MFSVGVLFAAPPPLTTSLVLGKPDFLLEGIYNPHGHACEEFSRLGQLRWEDAPCPWEVELPGLGSLDE